MRCGSWRGVWRGLGEWQIKNKQVKDIIEYFDFFCGWIFLWLISASLLSAVATGVIMLAKRIVVWKREKQSTPPKIFEIILGEYSDSEYYLFYNPKKKTQEQFDEDLKMLFRKYSVELIDGSDFRPREDTFGEFIKRAVKPIHRLSVNWM